MRWHGSNDSQAGVAIFDIVPGVESEQVHLHSFQQALYIQSLLEKAHHEGVKAGKEQVISAVKTVFNNHHTTP